MKQWVKKKKLTTNNMYNKPITQRVAYARSKKPSALKQTDTTVLKEEKIPVVKDQVTVNLPDTPGETKDPTGGVKSKGTCSEIAASGNYDKEAYPTREAFMKACRGDVAAGKGAKEPTDCSEGFTYNATTKKCEKAGQQGGTATEDRSQYMYDYGDSMPSYMQRKVYRGLEVGSRRTGKFAKKAYAGMSDAERAESLGIDTEKADWKTQYDDLGIKNKGQFRKAVKAKADKNAFEAAKAFAETQGEAARQGQSFGKKGTTRIGTFDPNERVFGGEGAVARERTLPDTSPSSQALENQEQLQNETEKKAAVDAAKNQDRVNKINDQKDTADKDIDTTAKMKAGPLKMKSSFKMGGYGSKTYKK
jgi:hypothetical protein